MTGGTEFSEAQEISKETPEVVEAQISLDRVTIEPEAAIEEGDIQAAEKIQSEFTAVVDTEANSANQTPASPTELAQPPAAEQDTSTESEIANLTDQNDQENEILETIADSDLTPKTDAAEARDQVGAAMELMQEVALRQSETARDVTSSNAPPEGAPGPDKSSGQSATDQYAADAAEFAMENAADQVAEASDKLDGFSSALEAANDIVREVETEQAGGEQKTTKPEIQMNNAGEEISTKSNSQKAVVSPPAESSLDGKTHDPGDHYSGVEMTQGEVVRDSDWNDDETFTPSITEVLQTTADLRVTEEEDPPAYDPDLKPEKAGTDQVIDFSNTTRTPQSVVSSGADLRSTDDVVKEMEEKLNSIGDDAELADIDLQAMLDKQQETIDMLAAMGEVQRETAETVVRKMALKQTSAGDTTETGEGGENQIVIPAGNSQIDFAGVVGEVSKTDSFTWKLNVAKDETGDFRVPSLHPAEIDPLPERTASGDHHQIPGDSADLSLTEKKDPPAYDPDLKPEKVGDSQSVSSDQEASSREDILILQDELEDWTDGETREITITTWEEGADGTSVKVEKTITLTKEEAEALLEEIGGETEGTEGQGLYNLEEGSLLVGEALGAELAPNADEFLEGMLIDRQEETSETSSHDEGTFRIEEMYEQARMLEAEIRRLGNIFWTSNSGEIKEITYNTVEKTGEHSYETVSVTTSVTADELKEIISALNRLKMDILLELRSLNSIDGPVSIDDSTQPGDNSTVVEISYTSNQPLGDSKQTGDNLAGVEISQISNQPLGDSNQSSDDSGSLGTGEDDDTRN